MSESENQKQHNQQSKLHVSTTGKLENNNSRLHNDQSFGDTSVDDAQACSQLPPEIQQLLGSNATEDLLQSNSISQQNLPEMMPMWTTEKIGPNDARNPSQSRPQAQLQSPIHYQHQKQPQPQQQHFYYHQTPSTQSSTPIQSSAHPAVHVSQPQPAVTPTYLLEHIMSQLPPERKQQLVALLRELQNRTVTLNQFYSQANMLLGQQQPQQYDGLKNKPPSATSRTSEESHWDNERMQTLASGQKRAEGAQHARTSDLAPQMKRHRTDQNPLYRTMGTPMSNAMPTLNAPAVPGQQIPQTSGVPSTAIKPATLGSNSTQNTTANRIDYDTLTDVMGYAGVDLKEESEHFLKEDEAPTASTPDGVNRSKVQDFMNTEMLTNTVQQYAKSFMLSDIDPDFISYLALATQDRLRGLIEQMMTASKHRVESQSCDSPPMDEHGHPLYKIALQLDVKKQLLAIERAEREEEQKRKQAQAERERRAQLGEDDAAGDENRPKKKKKEKEMGPGVSARTMSEDVRKRLTNDTALMSAGGVRKSWMLVGAGKDQARQSPGLSPAASTPGGSIGSTTSTGVATPQTGSSGQVLQDGMPRGRGRPRGRKTGPADLGTRRDRGRGVVRDSGRLDTSLFLPPSTIVRPQRLGDPGARKVTVRDAVFALERDCQYRKGNGQHALLKTYNQCYSTAR